MLLLSSSRKTKAHSPGGQAALEAKLKDEEGKPSVVAMWKSVQEVPLKGKDI